MSDMTTRTMMTRLCRAAGLEGTAGLTAAQMLNRLETWIRRQRFVGRADDVVVTALGPRTTPECTCTEDHDAPCPVHGMNRRDGVPPSGNPTRRYFGLPGCPTIWRYTQQGRNTTGRMELSNDLGRTWEDSDLTPENLTEAATLGEAKRIRRKSPKTAGSGVQR